MPTASAHAPDPDHHAAPPLAAAGDSLEAEQLRVLRELPSEFLRCRGDGHNWQTIRGWGVKIEGCRCGENPEGPHDHEHVSWGWRQRVCVDNPVDGRKGCGTSVEKFYSPTMAILGGGRNDYAEGYLTTGLGHIPPRLARLLLWERDAGPQPK